MEVACWLALLQAKRAILAGDHCQLPPTVVSDQVAKQGLATSVMQRLIEEHRASVPRFVCMLHMQYRMHEDIMRWSSKSFYEQLLRTDDSVRTTVLGDLDDVVEIKETQAPI